MAIIIPGTGTTGPVQTLTETVKNTSGGTLLKGTPVRITGATGQEADVVAADASTSFPANFVLAETLAPGESGQAVALGFINNVSVPNASLFTAGQEVYLGVGGGWTTTRPTGTANIQLLGNIVKVHTGANTVSGIFAPQNIEYLPNLTQGKVWVGNASGLPEEVTLAFPYSVIVACSGTSQALTAGTARETFRVERAFTLSEVRASLTTAATGSTVIVNINLNGVSVLGTKLSIDASELTSVTAASAATIVTTAIPSDGQITIDIDQVGATTPGTGLKVVLLGTLV